MVTNNGSYQDALRLYQDAGKTGDSSRMHIAFQAILPYFQKADPETLAFRQRCRELGFVVLEGSMSREKDLGVLGSHALGKSERVF